MEDIMAVDTETTGLSAVDRAFSASWKITGCDAKYVDFRTDDPHEFLNDLDRGLRLVCHNASFDYRMLHRSGYSLDLDRLDDTVIRATQINEHEFSYSLDDLSKKYLGREKHSDIWTELAQMFGGRPTREGQIHRLPDAPRDMVERYAILDAELAHDLWQWQAAEIERQGIQKICDFERSVMPPIIETEMAGIRVDTDAAERAVKDLTRVIDDQSMQLFQLAGGKAFNINSPTDVAKVFKPKQGSDGRWYTADGHQLPSTPGGKPSFSADSLRELNSPIAKAIVDIRSMIKTRDTFLSGHVLANAVNGRVYPSIHQTKGEDGGTGTGRFSYSGPAMQQIPSRNKAVAAIVKPVFLPDEGQVWVDADMHSFEVRVFAHLVNNQTIIKAYEDDPRVDFHALTASLTGLPRNAEYSGQANAKQLNLSMIFNSGNGAIAEKMGMPFTYDSFMKGGKTFVYKKAGPEAMEVIERYHAALPGVKKLADRAKKIAESFGYVETYNGRRMRFPRGERTYKASGLVIQATAADINKMNWLIIRQALQGEGRLILNTHDSYGLSLPENWQPHWERVKEAVEGSFPWFRVPIVLELSGAGRNWWEALGH